MTKKQAKPRQTITIEQIIPKYKVNDIIMVDDFRGSHKIGTISKIKLVLRERKGKPAYLDNAYYINIVDTSRGDDYTCRFIESRIIGYETAYHREMLLNEILKD